MTSYAAPPRPAALAHPRTPGKIPPSLSTLAPPTGHEGARKCRISEIDREGVTAHCPRRNSRLAKQSGIEAAVRASLAAGTGIRKTARLVGTGNATAARIVAEMHANIGVDKGSSREQTSVVN